MMASAVQTADRSHATASPVQTWRSSIRAQAMVIPGEDPAELEQLVVGYHRQFLPATPLENFLVDALVHADWQLRRLHKVESQLWASALNRQPSGLGKAWEAGSQVLPHLYRRIDAVERSYYNALRQLQRRKTASAGQPAVREPDPKLASFSTVLETPRPAAGPEPPPVSRTGPSASDRRPNRTGESTSETQLQGELRGARPAGRVERTLPAG